MKAATDTDVNHIVFGLFFGHWKQLVKLVPKSIKYPPSLSPLPLGCKGCNQERTEQCQLHGPHQTIKLTKTVNNNNNINNSAVRLPNAVESFPNEVGLCISGIPGAGYGVCAKQTIPLGTWIGPYEGELLRPEEVLPGVDASYMWEVNCFYSEFFILSWFNNKNQLHNRKLQRRIFLTKPFLILSCLILLILSCLSKCISHIFLLLILFFVVVDDCRSV